MIHFDGSVSPFQPNSRSQCDHGTGQVYWTSRCGISASLGNLNVQFDIAPSVYVYPWIFNSLSNRCFSCRCPSVMRNRPIWFLISVSFDLSCLRVSDRYQLHLCFGCFWRMSSYVNCGEPCTRRCLPARGNGQRVVVPWRSWCRPLLASGGRNRRWTRRCTCRAPCRYNCSWCFWIRWTGTGLFSLHVDRFQRSMSDRGHSASWACTFGRSRRCSVICTYLDRLRLVDSGAWMCRYLFPPGLKFSAPAFKYVSSSLNIILFLTVKLNNL